MKKEALHDSFENFLNKTTLTISSLSVAILPAVLALTLSTEHIQTVRAGQRQAVKSVLGVSPISCQVDGSTKEQSTDNESKGILETTSVSSLKLDIEVLEANARASHQMASVDGDEFRMLADQKTRELIDLQFSLLTEALEKLEAESLPQRKSEILEEILHESSKVVAHTNREFREYAKRKRSQLMVLIAMMRLQEEC